MGVILTCGEIGNNAGWLEYYTTATGWTFMTAFTTPQGLTRRQGSIGALGYHSEVWPLADGPEAVCTDRSKSVEWIR